MAAPPVPSAPISLAGAATKGAMNAPVTIVEFSDFQCPFCVRFSRDVLPVLQRDYIDTGKVRFAFRHFPLTQIHSLAQQAAEYAECAEGRGAFWLFHDALFGILPPAHLDDASLQAAVRRSRLTDCLDKTAELRDQVGRDAKQAADLGIVSTPTFLVGRYLGENRVKVARRLVGMQELAAFRSVIEDVFTDKLNR